MAGTWEEACLIADGFARVYAEFEWYSGPRSGLAVIGGRPHYFQGYDWDDADAADQYTVWPASDRAVELEREQWAIFARWNECREAGTAGPESHPGQGGIDARYDELTTLLAQYRQAPEDARQMIGEVRFDAGTRYRVNGVGYWMRWSAA